MKEIQRTINTEKPEVIQKLGDGTFYYNYNIIEVPSDEETQYEYTTIMCDGVIPDYKKLVLKVLRLYITQDEEFDLINSYNEDIEAGITDSKAIKDYKDYLLLRKLIKAKVKADI